MYNVQRYIQLIICLCSIVHTSCIGFFQMASDLRSWVDGPPYSQRITSFDHRSYYVYIYIYHVYAYMYIYIYIYIYICDFVKKKSG